MILVLFYMVIAASNIVVVLASSINTTTSVNFDESMFFSTKNNSITFFAHADWGKGGYDGYQHRRDRIKKRSLDSEETDKDREKHEDGRSEEIFYQGYTARSMLEVAAMTKPSFILALGDNFYDDGVNSTEDIMVAAVSSEPTSVRVTTE